MTNLQERLEKKDKGEVERDDVPQVTQKDLDMAEKVSKYNVSRVFIILFLNVSQQHNESFV